MDTELGVDERAATIIKAVLANDMTESEGRYALAEIAGQSRIIESVVRRLQDLGGREGDVVSHITERVTMKIMVSTGGGYDFQIGQHASFSGFIRRLAQSVAPSAVRDEIWAPLRRATPVSGHPWGISGSDEDQGDLSLNDIVDERPDLLHARVVLGTTPSRGADEDMLHSAEQGHVNEMDAVIEGASHMFRKPEHRPHYYAAIVRAVTGVPEAIRPASYVKRKSLLRRLSGPSGVALAEASLRAFLRGGDADELGDLVDLWGDFSVEDARILLLRGGDMTHAVALAAVSDFPLLNKNDRRALRLRLEQFSDDPEYRINVADLERSLLAVECHWTISTTRNDATTLELSEADVKSWRPLLATLAHLDGSPLGGRVTEVAQTLRGVLLEVMPAMDWEAIKASSEENLQRRGEDSL